MSTYHIEACDIAEYTKICKKVAQTLPSSVHFLQAPLYGRLQTHAGKEVVYFSIRRNAEYIGCGIGVIYAAPGGLRFIYCPYGPTASEWSESLVSEIKQFFRPIAHEHHCAFVRIDQNEVKSLSVASPIPDKIARTASLQPRAEWLLDITPTAEDIWAGFHKHARYNVRLAERAAAITTVYSPAEAPRDAFFELMKKTGDRDGFGIFDKSYYESYLDSLANEEGFMVMTTIDGVPAATGIFVSYDQQTHYVFAGSSDQYRKIAPAYTVIWTAIQEAKKRQSTLFNFGGVTDAVKGQHLGGVTGFKKRFGGYQIDHQNPVDLVYKPLPYLLFRIYKTLR